MFIPSFVFLREPPLPSAYVSPLTTFYIFFNSNFHRQTVLTLQKVERDAISF